MWNWRDATSPLSVRCRFVLWPFSKNILSSLYSWDLVYQMKTQHNFSLPICFQLKIKGLCQEHDYFWNFLFFFKCSGILDCGFTNIHAKLGMYCYLPTEVAILCIRKHLFSIIFKKWTFLLHITVFSNLITFRCIQWQYACPGQETDTAGIPEMLFYCWRIE